MTLNLDDLERVAKAATPGVPLMKLLLRRENGDE